MKKVSLAFPVYNVEFCVKESLISALNQTYNNIEYIIIDDKGIDESMAVVYSIVENHPRKDSVKFVIHDKNRGHGGAANTAIQNATGDYIFFLDSDDILKDDAIETLVRLEDDSFDVVIASYRRINKVKGNNIPFVLQNNSLYKNEDIVKSYFLSRLFYEMIWGKLYRKDFLVRNNIHLIENCNHEDPPFTFEVVLCAQRIRLSSSVIYDWIFRDGSTTSLYKEKNVIDLLLGFRKMLEVYERYRTNDNLDILLKYINNFRLYPIWLLLKNTVQSSQKNDLLRGFMSPILQFHEVLKLRNSFTERIKHFIFLLPYTLKKNLLKFISYTQL